MKAVVGKREFVSPVLGSMKKGTVKHCSDALAHILVTQGICDYADEQLDNKVSNTTKRGVKPTTNAVKSPQESVEKPSKEGEKKAKKPKKSVSELKKLTKPRLIDVVNKEIGTSIGKSTKFTKDDLVDFYTGANKAPNAG